MNNSLHILLLSSVLALFAVHTAHAVTISAGTEYSRPSSFPKSASGITYAGGDTYYVVADNANTGEVGLYKLTLTFGADGKSVTGCTCGSRVELPMTTDLEACAFDPASDNVWCADEQQKTIREYDPDTGAIVSTLDVPAVLKQIQGNYGFESLTISGDGLTMWTANEESLSVDGPRSSHYVSATNRLVKFTRTTVNDEWRLAAMYPYVTDKWHWQYNYGGAGRRGISDLCALPDGSLLVLERELSAEDSGTGPWAGMSVDLYHVVYLITPAALAAATDVKDVASLKNGGWTAVAKTSASAFSYGVTSGWKNYEGMCFGKRLAEGTFELIMLSDAGDGYTDPYLRPNALSDIGDVKTLAFGTPSVGTASIHGTNYRFKKGDAVDVTLSGGGVDPVAYTNNGAACVTASWQLPKHSPSAGTGIACAFTVAEDDALTWNVSGSTASTAIGSHDSFEPFAVGTETGGIAGWSGDGEVEELAYVPPEPPGYVLPREGHSRVLNIDGTATRTLATNIAGNRHIDLMVEIRRPSKPLVAPTSDLKVCLSADEQGRLCLWHLKNVGGVWTPAWTPVSNAVHADGTWIRVGIDLEDNGGVGACRVKVNGSVCPTEAGFRASDCTVAVGPWHRIVSGTVATATEMLLSGSRVDDVLVTTDAFPAEHTGPTSTNGIAFAWFDQMGLPRDPDAPAPRLPGKTVRYIYDSGVDPYSEVLFAVTQVNVGADGKVRLDFNGYKGDDPGSAYQVLRSVNLSDWAPKSGKFEGDAATWSSSWEGTEDDADAAVFYKVKSVSTAN